MYDFPTLLIVDDEAATRDGLLMALDDSFDCYTAASLDEAQHLLKAQTMDLVLTDLRLGGNDSGLELITFAQTLAQQPTFVVMTAYGSVDTAVEAMKKGAWHFITKPLNLEEVELCLKRAAKSKKIEVENLQLKAQVAKKQDFKHLLGNSDKMIQVYELLKQLAPTKATTLITGETGTGKERVAHTIHQLSDRSQQPFVIVNCAALSPQLLESELFGHEKGAFTGAISKRIGRFEEANHGTLFLDEIGEIDASTQVKLLRALSEKTIERVGSNQSIKLDVRVIAATNKNLESLVMEKTFREDLFFRLNSIRVELPPLRERVGDVALLAQHFLHEICAENNLPLKQMDADCLAILESYPWPGNVRELRSVVEHGVIMSSGEIISSANLPGQLKPALPAPKDSSSYIDIQQDVSHSSDKASSFDLKTLEENTIKAALEHCNGNKSKAAELLGISRRTLQRKFAE